MKLHAIELINWYTGTPEKDGYYLVKFKERYDKFPILEICQWEGKDGKRGWRTVNEIEAFCRPIALYETLQPKIS